MSEPSDAVTAPATVDPSVPSPSVTVRPLHFADLDGVYAGDEEPVLYRRRTHAGVETLDRCEVGSTSSEPVYARGPGGTAQEQRVGLRLEVAVRSVYGSETDVRLYSTDEAFDADYPQAAEGTAVAAARDLALARAAEPGVYVADPTGDLTLPVTPDWGSQVYVSVLVPDVDPDALAGAVQQTLDEQFPGHRLLDLQSRWVADRRVDVYRPESRRGATSTPLAQDVLEAEGVSLGSSFRVEQVSPAASRTATTS